MNARFTKEETDFIREVYEENGAEYIIGVFGGRHTYQSVKQKANKMGLKRFPKFRMSKKQTDFIRANTHLSNKEIAEKLHLPEKKVKIYANNNKLRANKCEFYSEEDERFVRENYAHMTYAEMAIKLGRSKKSIHAKIKYLGLKRTTEQKKALIAKVNAHSVFKKGHIPKNTKHDGAISKRTDNQGVTYKYIRVSVSKWVPLHIYNYEKKYGPVPKGKILRSIDGNQLNCDPDNWQPVTRIEHLEMNSGRKNLDDKYIIDKLSMRSPELKEKIAQFPEMIEAKRQQLKLMRIINECTNKA